MDKQQLEVWLSTLDPLYDWDMNDMDNLERQIVRCIKQSGYINLPFLTRKE